jgi:hypothetical protein
MKNQLNCIQVSRHIKDIGQQPIHKKDASKLRDISQNKIQGTTILSYGSDINMMDAFSHCPIEKMIFR